MSDSVIVTMPSNLLKGVAEQGETVAMRLHWVDGTTYLDLMPHGPDCRDMVRVAFCGVAVPERPCVRREHAPAAETLAKVCELGKSAQRPTEVPVPHHRRVVIEG